MPMLVVPGSDDLAFDVDVARSYAAALPHRELAVIDGAGHAANRRGRLRWPHRGRLKWLHLASVVVGVDVP